MTPSDENINIHISESALKFIKSKRLSNPLILVNLGTRSGGGGCEGGGGGGGCGESGSGTTSPCANVMMVDGGNPGTGFVKVDTSSGVAVHLAKPVFEIARKSGNPIFITVKGVVMKKLILEGLDLASSASHESCPEDR